MVYEGVDPVTGKDSYAVESTTDERAVQEIQTRLQAQVDRQRSAKTKAELGYVIETWLDQHDGEDTTLDGYRGYLRRTIQPHLGTVPAGKVTAKVLETFYAQLRKCSVICKGQPLVDHRTTQPHECKTVKHRRKPGRPARNAPPHDCAQSGCTVIECPPHACKPMARSSVRQIHAIISGALDLAVRWEWIDTNPADVAKKPRQEKPKPNPPSAQEAARMVEAAFEEDYAWGMLVWLKLTTGPRRGEILARRFEEIDFDELNPEPDDREGMLRLGDSYVVRSGRKFFKDTKDHQQRQNSIDAFTLAGLWQLWLMYVERMEKLGREPVRSAFIFSYAADNSRPCNPDGITHRFGRLMVRLGMAYHLHSLRHYSATELIAAGVDIRTVAGRLGHGGGGTTTLRIYTAFVPEADKRAAKLLAGRLGRPPQRTD
ncbi:tyrosine-type recombinase/integrase [Kribbella sp. NPDC056951]|uniref:tyrosine-type recombinase/integrase n=1 Tax=Kribbella sp. NPDC056951 TaxID=3345978 RepID=UPI003639A0B6